MLRHVEDVVVQAIQPIIIISLVNKKAAEKQRELKIEHGYPDNRKPLGHSAKFGECSQGCSWFRRRR